MKEERLTVGMIKNGTVIDRIPKGRALHIMEIIGVSNNYPSTVSVAMNVPSEKLGKKDIVKVEDKELKQDETDKIALIAPEAKINIIRDWKVVQKKDAKLPKEIEGVIKCANPNCATNQNEPIRSRFIVEKDNPIKIRCYFCERPMDEKKIEDAL